MGFRPIANCFKPTLGRIRHRLLQGSWGTCTSGGSLQQPDKLPDRPSASVRPEMDGGETSRTTRVQSPLSFGRV